MGDPKIEDGPCCGNCVHYHTCVLSCKATSFCFVCDDWKYDKSVEECKDCDDDPDVEDEGEEEEEEEECGCEYEED